MSSPIVISKREKTIAYALMITVDATQVILDIFIATEIINHVIDVVVGALLFGYAKKKKLLTSHKTLILAATFVGEQIPFVNALPFWTYDLRNLYSGTVENNLDQPDNDEDDQPLNKAGVRTPRYKPPINNNGVRAPLPPVIQGK